MNEFIKLINNLFIENPVAQTIGIFAFVIGLIGYISPKDIIMKIFGGFSVFLFAVHFLLLGLYVGGALALIGSIRNIFSIKKPKKIKSFFLFFLSLNVIFFILTFKEFFSILALLSGIVFLYALFFLEGVKMRYFIILGNILDFIYALYGHSMGLLISTIIFTIGTSLSIVKIKYPNGFVYNFFEGIYFKRFYYNYLHKK